MDEQRSEPTIRVGTTLGRYEILGLIGAGGMGRVYRAKDGSLDREVAIKVLPTEVTSSAVRLSRFRREARILAALSHPNIGAIFGLEETGGAPFLVLELVPGLTLAERLQRGPMPVGEALDVARQVAAALEAAHSRGIVHRDLKPANVKRDGEGRVRVLDFGLAAVREQPDLSTSGVLSQSPTLTAPFTVEGTVLGTAPYMSPEQARGRDVDARTDLWALGCLLFALLTGRSPFARSSVTDSLAAVLGEEPDWSRLPAAARSFQWVLRRCLEKDPEERWRRAADVRIALDEIAAGAGEAAVTGSGRSRRYGRRALLLSALAGIALAGLALAGLRLLTEEPAGQAEQASPTIRFSFRLPRGYGLDAAAGLVSFAFAPDGSFLVVPARPPGAREPRIFRRSLDSVALEPVPGTEGGRAPFVSPDGRWIGYFTSEGGLAKVPVEGGVPQRIFHSERLLVSSASWGPKDRIFFSRGLTGGIGVVSAWGRGFERLTHPDSAAGEVGYWNPQPLLGGRKLLFQVMTAKGWEPRILDLATGSRQPLEIAGASLGTGGPTLRFMGTGHLVWVDRGELFAAPFDAESGRLVGEPKAFLSGVTSFSVSASGSLAYTTAPIGGQEGLVTGWSAVEGRTMPFAGGEGGQLRLSPDGRQLAVASAGDLWFVELDRGVRSRFTTHGRVNNFPVWSPDGRRVVFNSLRAPHGLYVRSADGVGAARLVLARESETVALPASWSSDGRTVAVTALHPDGDADVAVVEVDSGEHHLVGSSKALEHSPAFSPDGRWLAYASNESGRDEVYLRRYAEEGSRATVSTDGGTEPHWARDGRSLLFRRGNAIYSVEMSVGREEDAKPHLGRPRRLAELPSFLAPWVPFSPTWDVAPNGDLVYLRASESSEPIEIFVVVGWARDLPPTPSGLP